MVLMYEHTPWYKKEYGNVKSSFSFSPRDESLLRDLKWDCLLSGVVISASRELGFKLLKLEVKEEEISLRFRAVWGGLAISIKRVPRIGLDLPSELLELSLSVFLRERKYKDELLRKISSLLGEEPKSEGLERNLGMSWGEGSEDRTDFRCLIDPKRAVDPLSYRISLSRLTQHFYKVLLEALRAL